MSIWPAEFANSYPSAAGRSPGMKMATLAARRRARGRLTVVLRAGQQLDRGVQRHRPLSRPTVGSTQESI
jgi:hypothetical protein